MARIGIFVGTVYGNALLVAEEAQDLLQQQGHETGLFEEATLEEWQAGWDAVLVVCSTTGQGDLPDNIRPLYAAIEQSSTLSNVNNDVINHSVINNSVINYGVIALGDSSYELFCGAGKKFDALLTKTGGKALKPLLTIDAMEQDEPEVYAQHWLAEWANELNRL